MVAFIQSRNLEIC